jgi:integrase
MVRIDTKRGRDALAPRREPYFHKLSKGRYIGLRKLSGGYATWITRYRDDHGAQHYQAIGDLSETFDFDQAKEAAERWIGELERGVTHREEDGRLITVASVCMEYVRALRAEGRMDAAHDAHMRFRRTVYGTIADSEFGPSPPVAPQKADPKPAKAVKGKAPKLRKWNAEPHEVADLPVSKVRAPILKKWHVDLVAAGLSKAAANRTLTALKAALNKAVADRRASPIVAQEWAHVAPLKGAAQRRELFLDIFQRRALLAHAAGGTCDLIEAAMYTGCRAGELTSARRSAFDPRTRTLSVSGKTGSRTMPLAPAAVELFQRLSRDKLPTAYLLVRDDGKPWGHSDWDEFVKRAAGAAGLPPNTCLYTLRHSFITQALLDGVSTLEVAKIVGTSLPMIEKHYGHLVFDRARERLAKVQIV